MRSIHTFLVGLATLALVQGSTAAQSPVPRQMPGVHNLMQLPDKVYSGSEPVGEEAFDSLKSLGVQTIVSVDGATPNLKLAKRYGMQYVHIPFGYDSIAVSAQLSLTQAARQSKTPIYIHCHHGKHRGPAAAAIVCRAKGLVDVAGALKIMEIAGTSHDYSGLWHDVEHYAVPSDNAELPQLVEVAKVESLPAAMARIDRNFDNLKICAAAEWKSPADHPKLIALKESLLLQESLHEACRRLSDGDHGTEYDATFGEWLNESNRLAATLHESLQAVDTVQATATLLSLQKSCIQCHSTYRDH